jgi:hypothetical protein
MTKNNKAKRFDCIEMKARIQRQIYDETKNMSVKELLRYFNGNGALISHSLDPSLKGYNNKPTTKERKPEGRI